VFKYHRDKLWGAQLNLHVLLTSIQDGSKCNAASHNFYDPQTVLLLYKIVQYKYVNVQKM